MSMRALSIASGRPETESTDIPAVELGSTDTLALLLLKRQKQRC